MSKLPSRLQPLWPVAKRVHRLLTFVVGLLARATRRWQGERAVPRGAVETVDRWRAGSGVTVHGLGSEKDLGRTPPPGEPAGHWVFSRPDRHTAPRTYCLEVEGGTVVGGTGAIISRDGLLDFESSPYFGVPTWREHPLYLRGRLPRVERVDGDLAVLTTRGGGNYYHFIIDVLPRLGVLRDALPGRLPDAVHVPDAAPWQRELLAMAGLGGVRLVGDDPQVSVRADRLLVPSLPNANETAPPSVVGWVREHLRPTEDAPQGPLRLYVTRGDRPNTRRVVREAELWPLLEERGFTRVDPGTLGPQQQVDVFSAAEIVVGPHGAALTNVVHAPPGVAVLELFTAAYVNQCYWSICQSVPDARYEYLIDGDVSRHGPGDPMNAILADIDVDPARVVAAVDRLLQGRPRGRGA